MPFHKILTTGVCLTMGNYLYLWMSHAHDWHTAGEHTWFEWVALFTLWSVQHIEKWSSASLRLRIQARFKRH